MKSALALGTSVLLLAALPAAAASYPGQDVTVNAQALGSGYLLYPGGKFGRFVPHLLQPGEKPARTVHLHMPRKASIVRPRKPKPAESIAAPAPSEVAAAPAPSTPAPAAPSNPAPAAAPPAAPPPRVARPTAPAGGSPDIAAMPENSASRLVGPTAPTPDQRVHSNTPAHIGMPGGAAAIAGTIAASPPPKKIASAAPPPATTPTPFPDADSAGMNRQSVIPFPVGSSTPAASDVIAIHGLAGKLSAALTAGAAKVQLLAYGGPRGDKSSDSRRLSLKRALVIRELLIEDGVPSEKIDVRAMGGADDSGAPDRVDIFLRS